MCNAYLSTLAPPSSSTSVPPVVAPPPDSHTQGDIPSPLSHETSTNTFLEQFDIDTPDDVKAQMLGQLADALGNTLVTINTVAGAACSVLDAGARFAKFALGLFTSGGRAVGQIYNSIKGFLNAVKDGLKQCAPYIIFFLILIVTAVIIHKARTKWSANLPILLIINFLGVFVGISAAVITFFLVRPGFFQVWRRLFMSLWYTDPTPSDDGIGGEIPPSEFPSSSTPPPTFQEQDFYLAQRAGSKLMHADGSAEQLLQQILSTASDTSVMQDPLAFVDTAVQRLHAHQSRLLCLFCREKQLCGTPLPITCRPCSIERALCTPCSTRRPPPHIPSRITATAMEEVQLKLLRSLDEVDETELPSNVRDNIAAFRAARRPGGGACGTGPPPGSPPPGPPPPPDYRPVNYYAEDDSPVTAEAPPPMELGSIAVTLTGIACAAMGHRLIPMYTSMARLGNIWRGMQALRSGGDALGSVLSMASEYLPTVCREFVYELWPSRSGFFSERYADFMERYTNIVANHAPTDIMYIPGVRREVQSLHTELLTMLRDHLPEMKASPATLRIALQIMKRLDEYMVVCRAAEGYANHRRSPFCIWIHGETRMGKSALVTRIVHDMAPEDIAPQNLTYARCRGDDFWSGYYGQWCCVFDDIFTTKETEECHDFMQCVSHHPYMLNMPSLSSGDPCGVKGTLFTSKMVLCASNSMYPVYTDQMNSEALWARRNVMWTMVPHPDYSLAVNGPNGVTLRPNFELAQQHPRYEQELPHLMFRRIETNGTGNPIGPFMTYQEMLAETNRLRDDHEARNDSIEATNKRMHAERMLKQYAPPPCNALLTAQATVGPGRRRRTVSEVDDNIALLAQRVKASKAIAQNKIVSILESTPCVGGQYTFTSGTMWELTRQCALAGRPCPKNVLIATPLAQPTTETMTPAANLVDCDAPKPKTPLGKFSVTFDDSSVDSTVEPDSIVGLFGRMMDEPTPPKLTPVDPSDDLVVGKLHLNVLRLKKRMMNSKGLSEHLTALADELRANEVSFTAWLTSSKWAWIGLLATICGVALGVYGIYRLISRMFSSKTDDHDQPNSYHHNKALPKIRSRQRGRATDNSLHAQGYSEDMQKLVCKNHVNLIFHDDDNDTEVLQGIIVQNGFILIPAHFSLCMLSGKPVTESATHVVIYRGEDEFDITLTPRMWCRPYNLKVDVCLLDCTGKMPAGKNLFQHFIKDDDEHYVNQPGMYIGTDLDVAIYRVVFQELKPVPKSVRYDVGHTRYEYIETVKYAGLSQEGACGGALVSCNHRVPRGIVGIHTYGSKTSTTGGAVLVTQELLREMMTCSDNDPYVVHPETLEGQGPRFDAAVINNRVIGQMPSSKVPNSSIHTQYEKTDLFEADVVWSPEEKRPAALAPRRFQDKLIDPLKLAYYKLEQPYFPPDPDIFYVASKTLEDEIVAFKPDCPARVFSTSEAINGIVGARFVKSINMSSAEGYPYILRRPKGFKSKRWLFTLDEAKGSYTLRDPGLIDMIATREHLAKKGKRCASIWTAQLKDETRFNSKVDQMKTRLFCFPPVDYTIVCKKYFGAFCSAMYASYPDSWSAVGMDPHSREWQFMLEYLQEASPFGFDGDYSNYDASLQPMFMQTFVTSINKWYFRYDKNWTEDDDQARDTLLKELNSCHVLYRDTIIRHSHGHPSGGTMTSLINTMMGRLYILMSARSQGNSLLDLDSTLRCKIFGDDLLVAVDSKHIGNFTAESHRDFLSTMNVGFTPPDKLGCVAASLKDVNDLEFLSCHTDFDTFGNPMGCLRHDAMKSMVNWKKKTVPSLDHREFTRQTLSRFLFFHGPLEYGLWSRAWLRQTGSSLLPFDVIQAEYYQMGRSPHPRRLEDEYTPLVSDRGPCDLHTKWYPAYFDDSDEEMIAQMAETESLKSHGVSYEFQPNKETVDAAPGVSPAPAFTSFDDLEWTVKGLAEKLTYSDTISWKSTDPKHKIIYEKSVPWDLITSVQQGNMFKAFKFWRGSVSIQIVPTATPFHQGQLMCYFVPLVTAAEVTAWHATNINAGMVLNHCFFEPHDSTPVQFDIPFRHQLNCLTYDNKALANWDLGRFIIQVVNPLFFASTTDAVIVPIAIHVSFRGSKFRVPHPTAGISLDPDDVAQFLEWKRQRVPTQRVGVTHDIVQRVANLSTIPEDDFEAQASANTTSSNNRDRVRAAIRARYGPINEPVTRIPYEVGGKSYTLVSEGTELRYVLFTHAGTQVSYALDPVAIDTIAERVSSQLRDAMADDSDEEYVAQGQTQTKSHVEQYFYGSGNKGEVKTEGGAISPTLDTAVSVPVASGMSGQSASGDSSGGGGGGKKGPMESIGGSLGAAADGIKGMVDSAKGKSKSSSGSGSRLSEGDRPPMTSVGRPGQSLGSSRSSLNSFGSSGSGYQNDGNPLRGSYRGGASLDAPNWPMDPFPVLRAGFASLPNVTGVQFNTKLTLNPNSQQVVTPEIFGGERLETQLDDIMSRMTLLTTVEWPTSSPKNTKLTSFNISPVNAFGVTDAVLSTHLRTGLDFMCCPWNYWTGGLVYVVQFIGTRFHTGKLWFSVTYGSSSDPAGAYIYNQYGAMLSFGEEQKYYSILVPYRSYSPYLSIPNGYRNMTAFNAAHYFVVGRAGLYVNVPLVAGSGVHASVQVNVFIAAAADFQVAGIGSNGTSLIAQRHAISPAPFFEYVPPTEEEEEEYEAQMASACMPNTTPQPTITIGGSNPSAHGWHMDDICNDVNELCKRYTYIGTYTLSEKVPHHPQFNNTVAFQVFDLATLFADDNTVATANNGSTSLQSMGWFSYYGKMYAAYRGPIRFKLIHHGTDVTTNTGTTAETSSTTFNTADPAVATATSKGFLTTGASHSVATRHSAVLWAAYVPPTPTIGLGSGNYSDWTDYVIAVLYQTLAGTQTGGSVPLAFRGALQVAAPGASYLQIEVPYNSVFNCLRLPHDTTNLWNYFYNPGFLIVGTTFRDNPLIDSVENVDIFTSFADETRLGFFQGIPYTAVGGTRSYITNDQGLAVASTRVDALFPARHSSVTLPVPTAAVSTVSRGPMLPYSAGLLQSLAPVPPPPSRDSQRSSGSFDWSLCEPGDYDA
jgi:hypothetical protein